MQTKDENYLRMVLAVRTVCTKYESVWNVNKRFGTEVARINELWNELQLRAAESKIVTTGATKDKAEAAQRLYTLAVNLGKRASVYALDNDNQELHSLLRTSRGALYNMHFGGALNKIEDLAKRINDLKENLVDYGITAEDLAELDKQIAEFSSLVGRPRDIVVQRKGHNDTIPELLKDLRKSLYKTDSLINLFAESDFETDYRNARVVVDLGRQSKKQEK